MHKNSLVKFTAILFTVISLLQISYTYVVSKIEQDALNYSISSISESEKDFSIKRDQMQRAYLDSVANIRVFGITSYKDAKEKELNKGLDLKGGINVILQISVKDILKGLAENSNDPLFNQSLDKADELQKSSNDTYLESFFIAFEENLSGNLASPDIFANRTLSDEINFQMSNDQVKPILRTKIDESITSAFEVLRKRIDKFGVTQPNIQRLGNSGRILVELPGAKDVERVKKLLQSTAQLEFWTTEKNQEFFTFLSQANQVIKDLVEQEEDLEKSQDKQTSEIEDLLADVEVKADSLTMEKNPLLDLIIGTGFQGGPVLAQFYEKDVPTVDSYLNNPKVRQLIPANKRFTKFLWGIPDPETKIVDLYIIKANRNNIPPLGGGVVVDASQGYDQVGNPAVNMQMNGRGAKLWEDLTGDAYKNSYNIAIVLDETVYSAPGVTTGPISGGRSEITGDFSLNDAIDLANVLRAGKLPASADIIQSEIIGPSLGKESIEKGINSFLIALVLVLIWMYFYYGRAGLFADSALVLNIVLIFGFLSGLGAVLTLPGIAGIVLTIGMSVDANVLIFERIREELRREKGLKQAVSDGFSNALSSILDANITTGVTALVLFVFGTGPIKGFATTLLIGIMTSLFTAIFITRILVENHISKSNKLDFSTLLTKNWLSNINISFLIKRRVSYVVSGTFIVIGLSSLFLNGLNQGVDFVGGRSYIVRFEQPVSQEKIQSNLIQVLGNAEVKTFGSDNQLKITTNYKVDTDSSDVDDEINNILFTDLNEFMPENIAYEDFVVNGDENKQAGVMSSIKVGPTIADDIKKNSFYAVFGSLIIVFLYILLRFKDWQFSLGAVSAVFHDVLVVLGIFSLTYSFMPFNMEINQAFIAAVLTVIGYSLNDTVVVFDRIREYRNINTSWELPRVVDSALNSTLSRTLNTSFTTLVVLISIFVFGGESIRGFMFALIVGVLIGTYSSVFVATPVMYDTLKKK
ncbi:MAG: protein translocase subunit SecDF [Cryomorphaceae bacterium]|nr:MAG: protein translocase subunit SecDF [Cryomorphaceae bacterium]|tara:strand:- start:1325 stop:4267 length:2943 start_codon:yes stop_codon:yes gene_type:complete